MKYLFIGGPSDGQYLETEGAHYYTVAVIPPPADAWASEPSIEDLGYHRCFYFAHKLPRNQKVYAPEDWSLAKVIENLIRRYPTSL